MPFDRDQELVLDVRQPGGVRLDLAPVLELAQPGPEGEQVLIIPLRRLRHSVLPGRVLGAPGLALAPILPPLILPSATLPPVIPSRLRRPRRASAADLAKLEHLLGVPFLGEQLLAGLHQVELRDDAVK